ncbi:hypothetical protein MK489_04260 [Myxococcota bacterium]|nr:hypothetical protein [Myxococcota bacterium]
MPGKTFLMVLLGLVVVLGSSGCDEPPYGYNGGEGGGGSSGNSDYGYGGSEG